VYRAGDSALAGTASTPAPAASGAPCNFDPHAKALVYEIVFKFSLYEGVWTATIQIAALYRQSGSDRLEKQPTDLRRSPRDLGDGALAAIYDISGVAFC